MPPSNQPASQRARRGLAAYLALVVAGTAACQATLLASGRPITELRHIALIMMWVPGLASIAVRLALREGFGDVSFRLGGKQGRRMLLLAWLYPLLVGAIAYPLAWSTGLEAFSPPAMASVGLADASAPVKLAVSVGINLTLGTLLGAISAAGEELGWRGYMLTRLIDAGVPRPVLISGVIWGIWHLPLIVSGQYAAGPIPILSACLFMVSVVAAASVIARVRLESGSVWPAIVLHAAWNALIQGTFDAFTEGGDIARSTTLWTGESGVLVAAISALLALLLGRSAGGRPVSEPDAMARA